MGRTITFFQSPGVTLLIIVISSNLAGYGIMASPRNFNISPVMTFGQTDFFFPIVDKRFLIMLILMVNGSPDSLDWICGLLGSHLNRGA